MAHQGGWPECLYTKTIKYHCSVSVAWKLVRNQTGIVQNRCCEPISVQISFRRFLSCFAWNAKLLGLHSWQDFICLKVNPQKPANFRALGDTPVSMWNFLQTTSFHNRRKLTKLNSRHEIFLVGRFNCKSRNWQAFDNLSGFCRLAHFEVLSEKKNQVLEGRSSCQQIL